MTGTVQKIWRHPIKGIGCEPLDQIDLIASQPMPGDRAWALLHENAPDTDDWQPRKNFLVVANGPKLAQITARQTSDGRVELSHPDRPNLTLEPAQGSAALTDWVRPIWPDTQAAPTRLVRAPAQGMADNGLAQLSIMNLSSLRALSQKLGQALDMRRFRGNIWLEGLAPWEEFDLIGKTIQLGPVKVEITERIERCRATEANPATGKRDAEPVRALHTGWGHRDFGVYATVLTDGTVTVQDKVILS